LLGKCRENPPVPRRQSRSLVFRPEKLRRWAQIPCGAEQGTSGAATGIATRRWRQTPLDVRNDPQAALDELTKMVLQMMGASDVAFDDGAVRYYLIGQLIACNVFPNKRSSYA